ncbi:MAG TPA: hypothetical protein VK188_03245 [Holophaga sp.]|nr:hypothetical protein [Holophaga sp.]
MTRRPSTLALAAAIPGRDGLRALEASLAFTSLFLVVLLIGAGAGAF